MTTQRREARREKRALEGAVLAAREAIASVNTTHKPLSLRFTKLYSHFPHAGVASKKEGGGHLMPSAAPLQIAV